MLKRLIAICLLCGSAFAGTWKVNGVQKPEALLLDQSFPQTLVNGPLDVTGLINQYTVGGVGYIYASSTYAQVFELFGVSDSGSYVDTSAGSFQDQSFTVEVHPYGYAFDSTFVYSYGLYTTLGDNTSTPFQLQLSWSDYGDNGAFQTRGFYVTVNDGTSYYWKDVGNVTSLQISDFIGWEQGTPNSSFNNPHYVPAGSLYGENGWQIYAKNASGLQTVYSPNYSGAYDYGDYYGWSMSLSWDAVEGATSYVVYNSTANHWMETTETYLTDNGDYYYWIYGTPDVSPSSPAIENKDFLGGHNTDVSVKLNGYGQFETTVGTGISPLKVNSPTKVDNLNADLLDGQSASEFQPAGSYQPAGNYTTPTTVTQIVSAVAITNIVASSSKLVVSGNATRTIALAEPDRICLTNNRVCAVVGVDGTVSVNGHYDFPNPQYTSNLVSGTIQGNLRYVSANFMLVQKVYGGANMCYSTDKGITWLNCSGLSSSTPQSVARSSTSFYCGLTGGYIYRSTDGISFTSLPNSPVGSNFVLANTNSSTVIAKGAAAATVYRSIDEGASWQTAYTASGTLGTLLAFPPSNFVFTVAGGKFALSRDDGATWVEGSIVLGSATKLSYSPKGYLFALSSPSISRATYAGGFTNFSLLTSTFAGNYIDVSISGLILARLGSSAWLLSYDDGASFNPIPYFNGSAIFSCDSYEAFYCNPTRIYKSVFESPINFTLLQSNQGISKTNSWTDASSVVHTQIFNKGVMTLWTKNGL